MEDKSKIQFNVNPHKVVESILYVLTKRPSVNLYNILKILFEADKYHLNLAGRPVTGDVIIKMKFGTVPSMAYDILNQKYDVLFGLGIDVADCPFKRVDYDISKLRDPDMDFFSLSDIEALDHGINEYIDLSFKQVEQKNHLENCWINGEMNKPIPFESMITNPDVEEYLRDVHPLKIVI